MTFSVKHCMRGIVLALATLTVTGLVASRTDYLSVKKKFQSIETHGVKPGSRVPITSAELNAYVQTELPQVAPQGIRNARVQMDGNNMATGTALVDFVKLRTSQGKPPNWILRKLLEGEHELSVKTRIQSGGGKATVDIQRVEISGVPVQGSALDFLIQNYLLPRYPEAKIGKPFALEHGMDRIEVNPGVAYVVMK